MGYIFILVVGGLLVLVIVVAMMRGSQRKGGKTLGGEDVTPQKPAGDEPTPGDSSTASPGNVQAAQKRIPPS